MRTSRQPEPASTSSLLERIWDALGGDPSLASTVSLRGSGALPSAFAVSDLAAASIGAAGLALAELRGDAEPSVVVDRRLASFWFGGSLRPQGWRPPAGWDPMAGDYRARDGWIRLHTNAPLHRAAAERVLGETGSREALALVVAAWDKEDLETAIVVAGGCAAQMLSLEEWQAHPQGAALQQEPLLRLSRSAGARTRIQRPSERPLAGIRVLDLTRILAGPVATRFLAGYGAEVLRIDPPGWQELAIAPEVTVGKRCARLNLADGSDRATFLTLLAQADVLVHGYRPGALEKLGLGAEVRDTVAPGLVDVALNAYGWSGPWRDRRGFDSLVQMSAGLADAGRAWKGGQVPTPLPVQALDHATGYLMAAAAIRGLHLRRRDGRGLQARLSLAATASLLASHPVRALPPFTPETFSDHGAIVEPTPWGPAHRLRSPLEVSGAGLAWDLPAGELGASTPAWR